MAPSSLLLKYQLCNGRERHGPLTGFLTQKYGARLVLGLGGLLSAIGTGACFFAEDIWTVTILWGVVLGVGFGLSVPLFPVVITQHFFKKRAIALGVVNIGSFLGFSVFNGIALHLINIYGLSGTFLYISGIILHCVPLAMLLRKPNLTPDATRTQDREERTSTHEKELQIIHTPVASKEAIYERYQKIDEDFSINKGEAQTDEKYSKGVINKGFESESNKEVEIVNIRGTSDESKLNDLSQKCYKGVRNHLNELENDISNFNEIKITLQNHEHLQNYENFNKIPKTFSYKKSKDCNIVEECGDEIVKNSSRTIDHQLKNKEDNSNSITMRPKISAPSLVAFKIFLEPVYLVVLIAVALFQSTYIAFLTVIIDFIRDVGIPLTFSKYILLGFCICSSVGLLSFGWVTDNGHLTCTNFAGLLFVLRGITTAVIPFSNGLVFLSVVMLLQGLCESPLFNLFPLIITEYFKKEVQDVAISCRFFLCATLYLVTPTLIGYFRDDLGSYFYLFFLMSSCSLIGGALMFLAPYLAKCRCGRDEAILRNKDL